MIFGLLVEKISLPVAPRHRWLNRITLIGSPPVASRLQAGYNQPQFNATLFNFAVRHLIFLLLLLSAFI